MILAKTKMTRVHVWIIKWLLVEWFLVNTLVLVLLTLFEAGLGDCNMVMWYAMLILSAIGAGLSFMSFIRLQFKILVQSYILDNEDEVRDLLRELSGE